MLGFHQAHAKRSNDHFAYAQLGHRAGELPKMAVTMAMSAIATRINPFVDWNR